MKKNCEICNREYYINRKQAQLRRTCSKKCSGVLKSKETGGKKSCHWKGGIEYSMGYRYIYAPNHPNAHRYKIAEHRFIMEKKLGRYLEPDEIVHHINGDKLDNRPDNLILMDRSTHIDQHREGLYERYRQT